MILTILNKREFMTMIMKENFQSIQNLGENFDLDKVPDHERQSRWFKTIEPLIINLLKRKEAKTSLFIRTLFDKGYSNWNLLKGIIEWAENHVKNWEQIFALSARIKTNLDPDIVIYSALAEITAAKYLFLREFENIVFNKQGIDIQASFQNTLWNIEVTFISGKDFKTQQAIFPSNDSRCSPIYYLDSHNLINRLKSKQQEKENQIKRANLDEGNSLVIIVTYLLETFEPWLSHNQESNMHPIQTFIESCNIPTIVIGSSSVYEPVASFVKGNFLIDKLIFN